MHTSTTLSRPIGLIAGTVLTALVLTGCGSGTHSSTASGHSTSTANPPSYGPPAGGPHNAQDVAFVEDMLPHHRQAVEMADMALGRDIDPKVQALARQIKGAQAPEISTMNGWLTGWGEKVHTGGTAGSAMDAMGGSGHGMMSADDMAALDKARGKEFATMWLKDMTEHHTGAVESARMQIESGQNTGANKLAADIVSSQTAEITTMKRLLTELA